MPPPTIARNGPFTFLRIEPPKSISEELWCLGHSGRRLIGTFFDSGPLTDTGPLQVFTGIRQGGANPGPPSYTVGPLGLPQLGPASGRAINDAGDLGGFYRYEDASAAPVDALRPFVWWHDDPGPTPFMLAGSTDRGDQKINNAVLALNAAGRLGGVYCSTAHDAVLGFVADGKDPNWLTSYITIRPPARPDGTVPGSNVRGINSHGHICGKYDADGYVSTDVPGAYADVRLVLPGQQSVVGGINDKREVVGHYGPPGNRRGFLAAVSPKGELDPGTLVTVEAPPAWGGDTRLNSIDNHGLMTGSCENPPRVRHGFLCWRDA